MSFYCPDCSTAGTLRIIGHLELPPDSRSDEIALQIVKCGRCRFEGIAIYEESRRGGLGDEAIDHRGYYINESDLKTLKKKIDRCPNPRNSRCRCAVHRQLGSKDKSGRWDGLGDMELNNRFIMRLR